MRLESAFSVSETSARLTSGGPAHSATVFSLYAKDNCPAAGKLLPTLCLGDGRDVPAGAEAKPGPYWSLMFEGARRLFGFAHPIFASSVLTSRAV